MKHSFLFIALVSQIFTAIAQPSDSYIQSLIDAEKSPGIALAVVKDGHWLFERNLGLANIEINQPVTRNTIWGASTVSFGFVATAVMQLKEQGLLDLDNNINNYLPFTFQIPSHPTDTVTVRMLLTESADIVDNLSIITQGDSPVSVDSFLKSYLVPGGSNYDATYNFLTYSPGTHWQYSRTSLTLAAYIVERVTGDNFAHYCDTAIFAKLCMPKSSFLLSNISDTSIIAHPYVWNSGVYEDKGLWGIPDYPSQQLRTSLSEVGRFTAMLMHHGTYDGNRILDSASVVDMMQGYIATSYGDQGLGFREIPANNLDALWGVDGYFNGTGGAVYINYPRNIGIIMLTNGYGNTGTLRPLLDTLYSYALTAVPDPTDTFPACNTTLVEEHVLSENISIFPNPTNGEFILSTTQTGFAILTNLQGIQSEKIELKEGQNRLTILKDLPAGVYNVMVFNKYGNILGTRKLVFIP